MFQGIKRTVLAAVMEIRRYFHKGIPEERKFDVYAAIDGKLYVIMEYDKFLELIGGTKPEPKSELVGRYHV